MTRYILMILLAGVLVGGCVNRPAHVAITLPTDLPSSARIYRVKAFVLISMPAAELTDYARRTHRFPFPVDGFADMDNRTLYVRRPAVGPTNRYGQVLLDFNTLGHELWHLPELGHYWHTNYVAPVKKQ